MPSEAGAHLDAVCDGDGAFCADAVPAEVEGFQRAVLCDARPEHHAGHNTQPVVTQVQMLQCHGLLENNTVTRGLGQDQGIF